VLYVPTLETNLLSVKKLTRQGNTVKFEGDSCSILKGNKAYAKGQGQIHRVGEGGEAIPRRPNACFFPLINVS